MKDQKEFAVGLFNDGFRFAIKLIRRGIGRGLTPIESIECAENAIKKTAGKPVVLALLMMIAFSSQAFAATGTASWYSTEACKFNPDPKCPTANGESLYELEQNGEKFAAAWGIPFGTKIKVVNLDSGKSVVVTVRDRGPAHRLNRIIDLSKVAFQEIGSLEKGVINVSTEVLK